MTFLDNKQIAEFKKLLDGYEPNATAKDRFKKSRLVVIAGPVTAGKDTLRNGLINQNPDIYAPILSTTTRSPRDNEEDRKTYHFKSAKEVKTNLEKGNYLQGALVHNQQVSTLDITEIDKLKPSQIGVSILIVQTEEQMHTIKPDLKTIFLAPPDLDILLSRLQKDRTFSPKEANRRLIAAAEELKTALRLRRYYCLISEDPQKSLVLASNFIINDVRDEQIDNNSRKVITGLLADLKNYLAKPGSSL